MYIIQEKDSATKHQKVTAKGKIKKAEILTKESVLYFVEVFIDEVP